jgi:hypothetical protein
LRWWSDPGTVAEYGRNVIELEVAAVLGLVAVIIVGGIAYVRRSERPPAVTDDHEHEWGQWEVIKQVEIHTYPDPDEGRDLPDRIDGVVRRTCRICGLPQTKTIRGL